VGEDPINKFTHKKGDITINTSEIWLIREVIEQTMGKSRKNG
jgi:hypothetical protein